MNRKAVLEGLLYIVGEDGLTMQQAMDSLEATEEEVSQLLEELTQEFEKEDHGIQVVNYGGTYRFVSKDEVAEPAMKLFQMNRSVTLSPAALETLAIIAYKQPITRVEIEEIRGVGCDRMLRKLLSRNLIRECGRADVPGKPYLYEVTQEFMDVFKLVSLKELPELPSYESQDSETLFDE